MANSQCNFILLELFDLVPGQSYELVIFSRSFKSNITGEFLFGEVNPNIPVFVYRFSYQEVSPPSIVTQLASSQTVTLSCDLLGDVAVGNSMHYLFSVFNGTRFTLIHNVLRKNPSQIEVPSTAGSPLYLGFSKITNKNQFFHYYYNILTKIQDCYITCKTCFGTGYNQCLSCNIEGDYPLYYSGQCLEECPDSAIYVAVNSSGKYCLEKCLTGQYYNSELQLCANCTSSCAECIGEGSGLCLTCSSFTNVSLEEEAQYVERLFFQGSCLISCPSVLGFSDLIIQDNVTNQCIKQVQNPQGIKIALQELQYDKLDLSQSVKIRALIEDKDGLIKGIRWFVYPFEDVENYFSDKAFFYEYYKEQNLPTIQQINPNYFNYKSSEEVFVGVVAYTANYESVVFDLMEVQGSYPVTLSKSQISFTTPTKTLSYLTITFSGLPTSGAYCAVILEPLSLSLYGLDESSSLLSLKTSRLLLQPYIFFSSKYINQIQIPMLMDGPKSILDYGTSKNLIVDIIVRCENRFMAASEVTYSLNLTEQYQPSSMRDNKIAELHEESKTITLIQTALQISNALRVILPNNSLPENAQCDADSDCENEGKCMQGKCFCQAGYKGATCKFKFQEYNLLKSLLKNLISFLDSYSKSYSGPSLFLVRHLLGVLEGSLRCPELLSENQSAIIIYLVERMTTVTQKQAKLLSDYDILAILRIVNYALDYLRNLYWPNVFQLQQLKSLNSLDSEAKFNYIRNETVTNILIIVQQLYNFLNLVSAQLYPGGSIISETFPNFEIYLWASTEAMMFENFQDHHGISLGNLYIKIPAKFFSGLRAYVPSYSEFKIRVVKWIKNPFIFSEYSSYFSSNIINIVVLDANGSQIPNSQQYPILVIWNQETVESPSQCAHFNISHQKNTTLSRVFLLDSSMSVSNESIFSYPMELFNKTSNLILQITEYFHQEITYPEFEFVNGVSEISKKGHSTNSICSAYLSGDIVLISSSAKLIGKYSSGFYDYTNLWDLWPQCFGFWALTSVYCTFCILLIVSVILDMKFIPIAQSKIEARLSQDKILSVDSVLENKNSVENQNNSTVMEILNENSKSPRRRHEKIIKLSTIAISELDSPKKVVESSQNSLDDFVQFQLEERKENIAIKRQITNLKNEQSCTIAVANTTEIELPKSEIAQNPKTPLFE